MGEVAGLGIWVENGVGVSFRLKEVMVEYGKEFLVWHSSVEKSVTMVGNGCMILSRVEGGIRSNICYLLPALFSQ